MQEHVKFNQIKTNEKTSFSTGEKTINYSMILATL